MIYLQRLNHSYEEPRAKALQAAIVLRDCSLRTETSVTLRRASRTLMRAQAIAWRRAPVTEGASV